MFQNRKWPSYIQMLFWFSTTKLLNFQLLIEEDLNLCFWYLCGGYNWKLKPVGNVCYNILPINQFCVKLLQVEDHQFVYLLFHSFQVFCLCYAKLVKQLKLIKPEKEQLLWFFKVVSFNEPSFTKIQGSKYWSYHRQTIACYTRFWPRTTNGLKWKQPFLIS